MARPLPSRQPEDEVAALRARSQAIRRAAAVPQAEPAQVLDAALTELDAAIDALAGRGAAAAPDTQQDTANAERRLMQAVFRQAPVPMFLVDKDGVVRRANAAAGDLLGSAPGYPAGKRFTAFVNLPVRALAQTHLAAALRTGIPRQFATSLLGANGTVDCTLTVSQVSLAGDADQLIVTVTGWAGASAPTPASFRAGGSDGAEGPASDEVTRVTEAMTRRLDVVSAATRLLLEQAPVSESVMLQQAARLLARDLGTWVIIDIARRQRLRRQCVAGPEDTGARDLAKTAAAVDPTPESAPGQAYESRSSVFLSHVEEAGLLDSDPDGVPLLMLLGATSVLAVPLTDGEQCYGVLTLAKPASGGRFGMADAGLVEGLAEQFALAIRTHRMFRERADVADALQESLLPQELRQIPGAEIAAVHVAATEAQVVGGDFYDVYPSGDGWGLAIGEVCGMGRGSAGVTAAARHAIRVLAHWDADPAAVLSRANEIMLADDLGGRFVTAAVAHLRWQSGSLHVRYSSAGHPGGMLVTADARTRPLKGGGLPLGVFPDAEPATQEVDLAPGDLLFLFTDGVTGASVPGMLDFEDRLADELMAQVGRPPMEIVSRIRDVVLEVSKGTLHDNLTMFALRANEPPG